MEAVMKGTLVNSLGIICGSALGILLKKNVPIKYQQTVMQGLSLAIGLIGLQMALKTENILIIIISIVIGGLIGEFIDIDKFLGRIGERLTVVMGNKYGSVGEGFITGSLVFIDQNTYETVGAGMIVEPIEDQSFVI